MLHISQRGSPVRSMRWHPLTWSGLYDLEQAHDKKVKVNKIAQVCVEWGLTFLRSLSHELQQRILGVKGVKPLTVQEQEKLRQELDQKLGSAAGKFRFDDRLAFALPRSAKQAIREEAQQRGTKMSRIVRERIGVKF